MITRTATIAIRSGCRTPAGPVIVAGEQAWHCGWDCALGAARADVKPVGSMLRYPDVSKTHIVFSYANDLWLVPRAGAKRFR